MDAPPLSLLVEGWRFILHSFAIVNQWQLLALSRRQDVGLCVADLPYYASYWQRAGQIFGDEETRRLSALAAPPSGFDPQVTLRIGFPYDYRPAPSGVTVVYGTAEMQMVPDRYLASKADAAKAMGNPDILVVTPSAWSRQGFL